MKMKKVTFINKKGDSIELYRTPFFLTKIEGLGDVDANIQSQKAPGQDGSTYIDATLAERYIPIEVDIVKDFDINSERIQRVFNPKLGQGLLIYQYGDVRREILATPEHVPKIYDERPIVTKKVVIDLICHNPYWLDNFTSTEQMSYLLGGLSFPLRMGTQFATRGFQSSIVNRGDIETPVTIEFEGPVTNPIIKNITTGEMIKVNRALVENEKLVITTELGKKSVKVVDDNGNETNVFNWIDLDSVFWQLAVGSNIIEYGSDDDNLKSKIYIKFKNRYVGV